MTVTDKFMKNPQRIKIGWAIIFSLGFVAFFTANKQLGVEKQKFLREEMEIRRKAKQEQKEHETTA
eukprot:m.19354 g.19354  ORF g.19354 m.19354 type:complete len:66 (+) comp5102_c0_seq1:262-459(+)